MVVVPLDKVVQEGPRRGEKLFYYPLNVPTAEVQISGSESVLFRPDFPISSGGWMGFEVTESAHAHSYC